jgi:hypothetical protein
MLNKDALAAPKSANSVPTPTTEHNQKKAKGLGRPHPQLPIWLLKDDEKAEVHNNAHSLHEKCQQAKHQAHGAFWRAIGPIYREEILAVAGHSP